MTVAPHEPAGEVAPWSNDDIGLEDIDASDLVIPRIRIVGKDGVFEEKNSGYRTPVLTCILLGVVKQRIFWRGEIEETKDRPACKSTDFEHGFPNLDDRSPRDKRWSWDESNFDPTHFSPNPDFNGHVTLPCASCKFKDWGTKDGKSVQPACSEQHTYPLLYTPDEGETWITALLTLQKTGIKPSKQYISSFVQTKTPLFTVVTEIGLNQFTRGQVTYAVPKFKRGDTSDRMRWAEFGETMKSLRGFLRQPPRADEGETEPATPVASDDPWAGDAAPATAPAAAPVPAPAPTPAPAPASPAPAAQPAPAPTPAPAPEPVAASSAPAPAPAPADDDDDLPF